MTISHGQLEACANAIYRRCPNTYAKSYAHILREMIAHGHPEDHIRTQVLYTRGNLAHWRGAEAKTVRATLDRYLKESPNEPR